MQMTEKTEKPPVRVRIAPSPTGHLHLGTVRTALYNYLFAKKEGGAFIVRTEDTDPGRSLAIYEDEILAGFKLLGLTWDEGPDIGGPYGPYRQTERTDIYKKYLEKLLEEKKAYYCFCSKEDLESQRDAMLAQGIAPKYSGTCRSLAPEEVSQRIASGARPVIRLVTPSDIEVTFHDMIRGSVSVNSNTVGDFVIARDVSSPLYNFAVVVDDYEMKISHVIRGEDHITNTTRQILIQRAAGIPEVMYAHLPLILTPDRKKLSKRSLETSFVEYLKDGYLPGAVLNFLVLLGWAPEDGTEVLSLAEMISRFSIKRVQKAGAVFNMEKLNWFNTQYIKELPIATLVERLKEFVPEEWTTQTNVLEKAVILERERIKKLSDFVDLARFFFVLGEYETSLLVWQKSSLSVASTHLSELRIILEKESNESFTAAHLEATIMPFAEKSGRGEVLWPLRVALCGERNSPGPFDILEALGKEESLRRIDIAIAKIAGELSVEPALP